MNHPTFLEVCRASRVYIKDGKILKFRDTTADFEKDNLEIELRKKHKNEETLTVEDIEAIKSNYQEVAVETHKQIELFSFSEDRLQAIRPIYRG